MVYLPTFLVNLCMVNLIYLHLVNLYMVYFTYIFGMICMVNVGIPIHITFEYLGTENMGFLVFNLMRMVFWIMAVVKTNTWH